MNVNEIWRMVSRNERKVFQRPAVAGGLDRTEI